MEAEIAQEALFSEKTKRLETLLKNAEAAPESAPTREGVVVVGTTYFPNFDGTAPNLSDNLRGIQALETIKKMNKEGIDVCLVDAGSSQAFIERIKRVNPRRFFDTETNRQPATLDDFLKIMEAEEESRKMGKKFPGAIWVLNQKKKGYSQARVEAIKSVTDVVTGLVNRKVVVQMEIEKTELVPEIGKMTRLITEGGADIVIPDRGIRVRELGDEYDDLRGYPEFQAVSERKANLLIHQMLVEVGLRVPGEPVLDLFGGTRAFRDDPDLRHLFGETFSVPRNSPFWGTIKPENYSNAVYFPIYLALALKRKVASVPIVFSYSEQQSKLEQQDDSFAVKRQRQFDDIVSGSKLLIDFLGKKLQGVRARKVVNQETLLKILRESSIVDLSGMEWTGQNEFEEEKYYHEPSTPFILDKLINNKLIVNYLDNALASYVSRFHPQHAFLDWNEFERVRKAIGLLKTGVRLFGKTKEAEAVYGKYRQPILNNLFNATMAFYAYGDSEASRNLDMATFFAHAVEVPKEHYVVAVLLGTPDSRILHELNGLTKEFHIPPAGRQEIIANVIDIVIAKTPAKKKATQLDDLAKAFKLPPEERAKLKKKLNL